MTREYRKAPPQTSKTCSGCQEDKAAGEFYRSPTGRLRHLCKPCYAKHNRDQRTKHNEKRKEYDVNRGPGWVRSGREKYKPPEPERWAAYIKRTYGLEAEQFQQMLDSQGGVCAICRQECNRSTTSRMCVDHDHATGKIRGLLCFQCNVGLGKFKDDKALLSAAIEYLRRSEA
ncbi:MAG: endonuclease VII domain-containing protein [Pseudomonas sp.]|nr:endonuclease VII domain-containing protein [Pseudomonas sp.]